MIPFALLLALAAEPTADEPDLPSPLTLSQAEEIFLNHGLDLLIAEANLEGARGDLQAAGFHPNPILNGDFLYSPALTVHPNGQSTSSTLPAVPGWSAGLSDNAFIEDQLSGKRSLRIEAAARGLASSQHSLEDLKRTELSQLRQAFVAALLAEDNLSFAQDNQRSYQQTLSLNQIRFQKGDISQVDLSRIATAQLESLQAAAQAENGLNQARASLAFLLGARTHVSSFSVSGSLAYQRFPSLEAATADDLIALGLAHRPDLAAAVATREQKGYLLAQARRNRIPDIDLNFSYTSQWSDENPITPPTLSLGISSPVPIFYQQQGEVRRTLSDLNAAQRQEDKARAQVVSDVAQASSAYQIARQMVERMEGQLLAQAKLSRDLEQLLYQKGSASLLEFLDAQRTYTAANLEYRQDLASYWDAVYALEQATGVYLRR